MGCSAVQEAAVNALHCSGGGSLFGYEEKILHSVHIVQCRRRQAMPMEW